MSINSTSGSGRSFHTLRQARQAYFRIARCDRTRATASRNQERRRQSRPFARTRRHRVRDNAEFLPACKSFVLFVDDDEREICNGRKDRRPRADDDARFSTPDAMPLLGALVISEGGVQDGNLVAKDP